MLSFCFYFLIFAFLGWVLEVAFHAVKLHEFSNRGFCNGPICPIYGFGVALIALLLRPLSDRWLLLFVASVLVTTAIELVTGFVLDRLFHTKWWDYSENKCNLGGYICLRFSLIWGVLCMAVVKLLFPPIDALYAWIPHPVMIIFVTVGCSLVVFDAAVSTATVIGLNKRLAALDALSAKMRRGSDAIGKKVCSSAIAMEEGVGTVKDKLSDVKENVMEKLSDVRDGLKEKLSPEKEMPAGTATAEKTEAPLPSAEKTAAEAAEREYEELLDRTPRPFRRLLSAFPTMRSRSHNDQLNALREKLRARRKTAHKKEK